MIFDTRNVRSLYRAGSLMTVVKDIAKCKLDLVEVQEVRCDKGGIKPAGEYIYFCMERGMRIMNYVYVFLLYW
jgi:hypothetical protein